MIYDLKNFSKITLILLLISITAGCNVFGEPLPKSWNWGGKPRPLTGVRNFPETTSYYGKGFKDGCESAWAKVTRGLAETMLKPQYNYQLKKTSEDYNTGWFDGFEQCTYIVDWDVV